MSDCVRGLRDVILDLGREIERQKPNILEQHYNALTVQYVGLVNTYQVLSLYAELEAENKKETGKK